MSIKNNTLNMEHYTEALKKLGISYLGATTQSAKLTYSYNHGWETYGVYLALATLARDEKHPYINLCPCSDMCRDFCLNKAGHNKAATLHATNNELSHIDKSRIKKTHLFYDNRELFMEILIHEIERYQRRAKKHGMGFAVRLNCTSDLSPEIYKYKGKNILEIFPNVQFYDYTKVPSRLALAEKYPNYDLTLSYDGTNEELCKEYLSKGGKVAVVFDVWENGKQILPTTWWGFDVEDANGTDTRFLNTPGTIMGLHYHKTSNDYVNGQYRPKETPFIVRSL